ncbi:hypothetical protein C6499_12550 [Candidatus Poribacteria bacterium]|nr:MAG: hypothetical protein C6499_12550 [Candidatus Poribacteria bacterium]
MESNKNKVGSVKLNLTEAFFFATLLCILRFCYFNNVSRPGAVCAPDVLVTFGIGQKQRHTYKVWEEGKVPDFVMEFSSKTTYQNDLTDKMTLYAQLGIPNYLLYDAEALYLPSPLMGFQLVKGVYVPIPPGVDGSIHSDILGLDFHIRERRLEVYDSVREQWLQTPAETAEAEVARLQAELAHWLE